MERKRKKENFDTDGFSILPVPFMNGIMGKEFYLKMTTEDLCSLLWLLPIILKLASLQKLPDSMRLKEQNKVSQESGFFSLYIIISN